MRRQQARLDIFVAHGREIPPYNLELGVLADVVDGHLKHAQMKVGDWAEGTTRYKSYWCPRCIALLAV